MSDRLPPPSNESKTMTNAPPAADSRLRMLLADVGLAAIRDHRLANAAAIDQARQRLATRRQADAFTLLTTKPIASWTPEDHILFMDAVGENQAPAASPPPPLPRDGVLDIRMGTDPGRNGFECKIDPEIPF